MKYIVYCTTCTVNGKIYIGVHKTENPDRFDGYIGNGLEVGWMIKNPKNLFQRALKKHGYSKFKRATLFVFDSEEEAYQKEAEIVTKEFILRDDNYNTCVGGMNSGAIYKKIYQYDLKGDFIKEWHGIKETARHFKCHSNRFNIVAKEKRSAFMSFWSPVKVDKLDVTEYRVSQHSETCVYDQDFKLIGVYDSVKDMQRDYPGLSKSSINFARNKKTLLMGLYFVPIDTNIVDVIKTRKLIQSLTDMSVSKYDSDGKRVSTYPNISSAARESGISSRDIRKSIKGKDGIWDYGYDDTYVDNAKVVYTKIDQFDVNGNLVKTWDSISQCRKYFPNVKSVILGKNKTCGGYVFKIHEVKEIV